MEIVNSFGNIDFGKWFLYRTSLKEDIWHKKSINFVDNYISLNRINTNYPTKAEYTVQFCGSEVLELAAYLKNFSLVMRITKPNCNSIPSLPLKNLLIILLSE